MARTSGLAVTIAGILLAVLVALAAGRAVAHLRDVVLTDPALVARVTAVDTPPG